MKRITIKRGATFSYVASVNLPAGTWAVTSQVRNKSGVKQADVVITPPSVVSTGVGIAVSFLMVIDESITKDFDVSKSTSMLECDVFFSAGGFNLPTETFNIEVVKNITDVPV